MLENKSLDFMVIFTLPPMQKSSIATQTSQRLSYL